NPRYTVDFNDYTASRSEEEASILQNIAQIGKIGATFFYTIAHALGQATWETIKSCPLSFRYTVIGYNDFNLKTVIFRLAYWTIGLGLNWITLFLDRLVSKYGPSQALQLEGFIDTGLEINHITSAEVGLDVKNVPQEIQVKKLLEAFDKINFSDKRGPAYFPESTRREAGNIYTVDELRESLATFVKHVENRVVFLGTPPAYNTKKLLTFYQYIEDATRLTLEKVLVDLSEFEKKHPDFIKKFNEGQELGSLPNEQKGLHKQYLDLLENRSRLALDFAITGKHCGARYTGDVTRFYNHYCNSNLIRDLSLRDQMHNLLGRKRQKIAESYILVQSQDTHVYSEYMQKLGEVLGIPGTANIVEHLSTSSVDVNDALREFFSKYTGDFIIESIQKRFQKSQSFREAVYEWIKSKVQNWNEEAYSQDAAKTIQALQSIKERSFESSPIVKNDLKALSDLNMLLQHLRDENVQVPQSIPTGSSFIEEMFALEQVRNWIGRSYVEDKESKKPVAIQRIEFKRELKGKMQTFAGKASDWTEINVEAIKPELLLNAKVQEAKKHIQFEENADQIIKSMMLGTSDISEVIRNRFEKLREAQFLNEILNESIENQCLSKEVMEWLLVDHGIFKPQIVQSDATSKKALSKEEKYFVELIGKYKLSQSFERYNVPNGTLNLERIFDRAFADDPLAIITAAESTPGAYPLWKRVSLIEIPRLASKTCGRLSFRLAISIGGGIIFAICSRKAIEILGTVIAEKGLPLLVKHTPEKCYSIINPMIAFATWTRANPRTYIICLALVMEIFKRTFMNHNIAEILHKILNSNIFIDGRGHVNIFLFFESLKVAFELNNSLLAAGRFFNNVCTYGQRQQKVFMQSYFVNCANRVAVTA
ncbi:MAG: hypothetical protein KDK50_02570, partial [Chlamydiia bacterium]|nr:hypothetical protein [Chlamydiia bacterium]